MRVSYSADGGTAYLDGADLHEAIVDFLNKKKSEHDGWLPEEPEKTALTLVLPRDFLVERAVTFFDAGVHDIEIKKSAAPDITHSDEFPVLVHWPSRE